MAIWKKIRTFQQRLAERMAPPRELQIGVCGTFDVENYGDLLFPLVAEVELSRRLGRVQLHPFSYRQKTAPDWPYSVNSLSELPAMAGRLDGILIGGGHLIRFDKHVAPGYHPPLPGIHHPTGYWLTPALIALQHGLPVVWNAPGVHGAIPAWAEPLMQLAISQSSYVAVRDEPARQAIARFAGESEIAVVPDTVFGIAQLLDAERPSHSFDQFRKTLGLDGRYIVVQATAGLEGFWRMVQDHREILQDCQLVVLEIGPILGDNACLCGADIPGLVRLPAWPHPLLLANLIGHAAAAVGISMHLAITAVAFGVPIFRPIQIFGGKYSVLSEFDTVVAFANDAEIDPQWFATKLGRAKPAQVVEAAVGRLSRHWDQVAAAFSRTRTRSETLETVCSFWQSLPGLLEAA